MPSKKVRRASRTDAPTRPTEDIYEPGDRFKTTIHHLTAPDLFLTLDSNTDPSAYEWVVVELGNGEPVIELYEGQTFIGLARILDFFQLRNSEQWRPQIRQGPINRW